MNKRTVNVINGFVHKDYNYTIELAHFYRQITTGQGYGELIVNYKPRESLEQKEQRVRITQNRTKSIAGKIEGFFKRTFRPDKIKFEVKHESKDSQLIISSHIDRYGNDGQSLLKWSEQAALFYNNLDPNAFYWVKHTRIDNIDNFEPFVFDSSQVKDYEIEKGLIKWCVCELTEVIQFSQEGKQSEKTISILYTFTKEGLELAIEVNKDALDNSTFYDEWINEEGEFLGEFQTHNNKQFLVVFEESDTDKVPVTRMGYNPSKDTNGRTYVSFWDCASEEYKQLVNRGSEYDLSLTLHAFLQKIQYYTPCDFQDEKMHRCEGGKLYPANTTCPSCSGTGKKVHTSSQDVIEVQLPTADGEPNTITPKDFVFYVEVPTKIVEMQEKEVEAFDKKITKSVFGVDISDRQASNQATATAIRTYENTAQDALADFTQAPRHIFLFTVDIVGDSIGIDDIGAELLYPNDFDLESESSLIAKLDAAKKAGAPIEVIESIEDRISIKQNRNNTSEIGVFKAVRKFLPFSDIPTEILTAYVLGLPDSSLQKALFFNFKEIATDIANTDPTFLTKDFNGQRTIVEDKAKLFSLKAVQDNSVREIGQFTDEDLEGIPSTDE